jgi:hypothetical protein
MPYTAVITPLEPAEQIVSGVSAAVDLGAATTARLVLDVTSGTGLLTASLETADTATSSIWTTVDSFSSVDGGSTEERTFAGLRRYVRLRWTIDTGPFTFGLAGEAITVYCTPADIRRVLDSRSFVSDQNVLYTDVELDEYAQDASDQADEVGLGAVCTLPLLKWSRSIRRNVAAMAAYFAMVRRGFVIDGPGTSPIRMMYTDARDYFKTIAKLEGELQHVVDSTPGIEDGGAYVVTDPSRGWGS